MSKDLNQCVSLYRQGMSLRMVSAKTGISTSKVRGMMIAAGEIRSPHVAQLLAGKEGRKSTRHFGTFSHTEESKQKMSRTKKILFDRIAAGISLKPSGYVEITRGDHKMKGEHRVIMERSIGRKLDKSEHVHHINGIKSDNRLANLQVLKASEHLRLHANMREKCRNNKGQFI